MSTMACPRCGTFQLVPSPIPADLLCVACRQLLRQAPVATQVAAGPLPPHVRSAPPVSQPPVAPPPVATGNRIIPPSAAPVFVPKTQSASVPPADDDAKPVRVHRRRGVLYELVLFGGLFAIIVSGLAIASYLIFQRDDGYVSAEQKDQNVVVLREEEAPSKLADLWADGSRKSLRKNGLKVRIEDVEYFAIYGFDENQRLIRLGDQPYLTIRFNVRNQGTKPQRYTPWYGNTFIERGRTTGALLWDDQGNEYAVQLFNDVRRIQGQQFERVLDKNEEMNDLLVFEVPANLNLQAVKYWRLQLPGAAVGQLGSYRFELPAKMLKTKREEFEPM